MKIEGIYTPVITPFQADGSMDRKGYVQILEAQIADGVQGLVIGGTTGESYALTPEERVEQFRLAAEVIGRQVPWLAGVNDLRTEGVCALARAAREAGADGLLLGSPPYACPTAEELAHHVLRVQHTARLPVVLYNYPARTGTDMSREFLIRISRNPAFVAIKESSGDIYRIQMLAQEFPHLQLCCGTDDLALEFFAWGARAWICAAANFLLPECLTLYRTCVLRRDFSEGRKTMAALLPILSALERSGKFIQCVKCGCEGIGLPAGPVRLPLRPLSEVERARFRATLDKARQTLRRYVKANASRAKGTPSQPTWRRPLSPQG